MTGVESNDFLLGDARTLVAACDADERCRAYYTRLPLGNIWKRNERIKREILEQSGSAAEALAKLQTALFLHEENRGALRRAVEWGLRRDEALLWNATCGKFVPEDQVVEISGRRFWHDDFRHVSTLARASDAVGLRVLELGSGCGNLAYWMKRLQPRRQITLVDLPDTLVFAMMMLRSEFPDANFRWIGAPAPNEIHQRFWLGNGAGAWNFTFVPVGHEDTLHGEHFDTFVNTASMGEMTGAAVGYWMWFIAHKVQVDRAVLVNRMLNLVDDAHAWRRGEGCSTMMIGPEWEVEDFELMPAFLRCPWQNRHARQAFISARRVHEQSQLAICEAADALSASWWSADGRAELMTPWSPAINEDFGMSGVLFALWNAWRLVPPGAGLAHSLLRYMRYLRAGAPNVRFEEEIWLEGKGV